MVQEKKDKVVKDHCTSYRKVLISVSFCGILRFPILFHRIEPEMKLTKLHML